MKPNISEFSYGYAVTDELVHGMFPLHITAAPVFPSLFQEGQLGGGYDVMLDFGIALLFIQFKLSDYMTRRSAVECQRRLLPCPFYRMHLRARRHSRQHDLLLHLEQQEGQLVYYAAPGFHQPDELNEAFLTRSVIRRSVWIRPRSIGQLPDDEEHRVSFVLDGRAYVCSEPKRISEAIDAGTMSERLVRKITQGIAGLTKEKVATLAGRLRENAVTQMLNGKEDRQDTSSFAEDRHPLEQLAIYASRFLGAHVYVLRWM